MIGPPKTIDKKLAAWVITIGVQTEQLRYMPWETLAFGKRGLTGVREHLVIDDALLDAERNARDAAMVFLGPGPWTLADMQKKMNANKKELLECHEHFDLTLFYLNDIVDSILTKNATEACLFSLPTATIPMTIVESLKKLEMLE